MAGIDKQLYPFTDVYDKNPSCLKYIDTGHDKIHDGKAYAFYDSVDMAAGTTVDYLLVTPSSSIGYCHYTRYIDFIFEATITIYEGSDKNGVTSLASQVINKNRNGSDTNGITIYKGLTGGTTDGTLRTKYHAGGNSGGNNRFGGSNRSNDERILKPNTKYIIRIVNNSGQTNFMNILVDWYLSATSGLEE